MNIEDIRALDAAHTHSVSSPCIIAVLLERIAELEMNAVDGTDYAIMTARIATLEGCWRAAEAHVAELEEALREIATASGWGSNGFDLDGEFRLSRKAMKSLARRALGEDA